MKPRPSPEVEAVNRLADAVTELTDAIQRLTEYTATEGRRTAARDLTEERFRRL